MYDLTSSSNDIDNPIHFMSRLEGYLKGASWEITILLGTVHQKDLGEMIHSNIDFTLGLPNKCLKGEIDFVFETEESITFVEAKNRNVHFKLKHNVCNDFTRQINKEINFITHGYEDDYGTLPEHKRFLLLMSNNELFKNGVIKELEIEEELYGFDVNAIALDMDLLGLTNGKKDIVLTFRSQFEFALKKLSTYCQEENGCSFVVVHDFEVETEHVSASKKAPSLAPSDRAIDTVSPKERARIRNAMSSKKAWQ